MLATSVRGPVVAAFAAYVVLSVVGLVVVRANLATAASLARSGQLASRPVLLAALGVLCYGTSFLLWLVVLANVPLSQAYPVAVGATMAFSSVLAWALLGERMSLRLVAGIVTIFLGVVLVSTG